MVSVLGIVVMVLGRYLVFGYLDPYGVCWSPCLADVAVLRFRGFGLHETFVKVKCVCPSVSEYLVRNEAAVQLCGFCISQFVFQFRTQRMANDK